MDDFGFKKINVGKPLPSQRPIVPQSTRTTDMGKRTKKPFKLKIPITLIAVLLILIVFFGYVMLRAFAIEKDVKVVKAQAKLAYAAMKQNNVITAQQQLVQTQADMQILKKDVASIALVGYIPLAGGYYDDAVHGINAADDGISAGIVATNALIPYADVLGLKGGGSFTQGSAEDRIRLAVQTLGKVVPKIDQIDTLAQQAKSEIDQIDINRYPNFLMFKGIRSQIVSLQTFTDEGVTAIEEGKPLIKVLPQLLGDPDAQQYLVLFQNDKELRPTGGFITFYSIFQFDEGSISVNNSGDIYTLDDSISDKPPAPEIIQKYLSESVFNIRNANLSPDFITSMDQFNALYQKSSLRQPTNGIIAFDTDVLVRTLSILGSVTVDGTTFDSQTDARCNCPQVVYELESIADQPVDYIKTNRKGIVGDLLFAILEKALKSSPKLYWGPLFQMGIGDLNQKHILMDMYNTDAQAGIDALNWSGRIKSFSGDYLHINDANFGGQKSNMYVTKSVRVDVNTDSQGQITQTITINYKNPEPYSNCSLASGGLCLNATLRNFQRIYVPEGSTLSSSKGSEVQVTTGQDLGKTDFAGFLRVNPLGTAQITYTYVLPFKVQSGSTLPFLIQKQPGTQGDPYTIYVNGNLQQSFNLTTDQEVNLKI